MWSGIIGVLLWIVAGDHRVGLRETLDRADYFVMEFLERETLAARLDRVVTSCLAKNPDGRWESDGDLARELRWIAGGPGLVTAGAEVLDRGSRSCSGGFSRNSRCV